MIAKKKERQNSDYTLSPEKAAKIVGVSPRTIMRHADEGQIEHLRTGIGQRRRYRFHPDDIDALKDEWTHREVVVPKTATPHRDDDAGDPKYVSESANPEVDAFIEANRKKLERKGWSQGDFNELGSWYGVGGALTEEGVIKKAEHIQWKIGVRRHVEALLESPQAKSFAAIVETLYRESLKQEPRGQA